MSSATKMETPITESKDIGRVQVSANRLRRFYVFAARRLFAGNQNMKKLHVTALGSAIAPAIGIAHELAEMKVARIEDIQTSYQPLQEGEKSTAVEAGRNTERSIARILIVLERDASWKPEDSDFRKPRSRDEQTASSPATAPGAQ